MLFERQVVHLDNVATTIRRKSGKPMNRAEIIRALIDGLINSRLDLTGIESEASLRAHLARRLG